jgi:hypothetical protein
MDAAHWIELVGKIPRDHHEVLLVGLGNGMEISLQSILRVEESHLMVRGRISGTTEMGRVFFIPYQQITYLHFTRHVEEGALIEMFGELMTAEKKAPTQTEGEAAAAAKPALEPAPEGEAAATDPERPTPAPIDLRERLRARLAARTAVPKPATR